MISKPYAPLVHPSKIPRHERTACRVARRSFSKKVLENKTKGYKNHPQLLRFRNAQDSLRAINAYLSQIYFESQKRGYVFDKTKIKIIEPTELIPVTHGQIQFEFEHLVKKLKERDIQRFEKMKIISETEVNPIFKAIPGNIEP